MTRARFTFAVTMAGFGIAVVLGGCAAGNGLTPQASQAIQQAYPAAAIEKVKTEDENGVKVFEAEIRDGKQEMEIAVTAAGEIISTESPASEKDLPKAVAEAVAKAAPGAKIEKVTKEVTVADAKGGKLAAPKTTYEIEIEQANKDGELTVAADGSIVKPLKWESAEEQKKEGKDEEKDEDEGAGKHEHQDKSLKGKDAKRQHEDADEEEDDDKDGGAGKEKGAASQKAAPKAAAAASADGFRKDFNVKKDNWSDSGQDPYFVLVPGHRLTLQDGKDTLVITVLDETKVVGGVTTRVVEERETKGGKLEEVSRNYFAMDKSTGDVYYFGEDVDIYKDGKVAAHEGAWLSGKDGAHFGLMMPGKPKVGDKFCQELAPGVAMDRSEIASLAETLQTPAGEFKNVLRTKESSALEAGSADKLYAPGVGLLKDGGFVLVKIEPGR